MSQSCAPTRDSMFNTLGPNSTFFVANTTHHHFPPFLLPGSLVVSQARGEAAVHPGGGSDAGSPALHAGQGGLSPRPGCPPAAVLRAQIQDLVKAVIVPHTSSASFGSKGQGDVVVSGQRLRDPPVRRLCQLPLCEPHTLLRGTGAHHLFGVSSMG